MPRLPQPWVLRFALLFALLFALCALRALGQSPSSPFDGIAFQRAQHLKRGINTSSWFAQRPHEYTVERLRSFITPDDLKLIHELGFDHIRLSVDATPLLAWQQHRDEGEAFVTELDRVVRTATANGLAVIVDIHPEHPFKETLFTGEEGVQRFAMLWHSLAAHFSGSDPKLVFFEIMNEPEQTDPYRWNGIESVVSEQIRAAAPAHTIIATGAHWSGLADLLALQPLADANVIYTFHDYEPFAFTHQGATWTSPVVEPLRGVPYPSTPDNVAGSESEETSLAGRLFVQQYGMDQWNAARVKRTIGFAELWSKLHHVPVYCGEFGVYRAYAPAAARARWLYDMRVALEEHNIGWAMWDYSDSFGLVVKQNGATTIDPNVLKALGMTNPK